MQKYAPQVEDPIELSYISSNFNGNFLKFISNQSEEDKKNPNQYSLLLLKVNGKKFLKFVNDYYNYVLEDFEKLLKRTSR